MNKGAAGRFRNITNATKPWLRFRRRHASDDRAPPDIHLKRKGRWHRESSRRGALTKAAVYLLLAAGAIALCIRFTADRHAGIAIFFLAPFALVGAVALWSSKLPYPQKAMWTIPLAIILLVAFV